MKGGSTIVLRGLTIALALTILAAAVSASAASPENSFDGGLKTGEESGFSPEEMAIGRMTVSFRDVDTMRELFRRTFYQLEPGEMTSVGLSICRVFTLCAFDDEGEIREWFTLMFPIYMSAGEEHDMITDYSDGLCNYGCTYIGASGNLLCALGIDMWAGNGSTYYEFKISRVDGTTITGSLSGVVSNDTLLNPTEQYAIATVEDFQIISSKY